MKKNSSFFIILSLLVISSMLLAGCASPTPQVITETQIVVETQIVKETQVIEKEVLVTPTPEPVTLEGPYEELARAKAGEFAGTQVTLFGNYTAQDEANFQAALLPFAAATGIEVSFEGSADFAQLITVRVEAGDAPDIAEMSQPALMTQLAEEGHLVALDSFMNRSSPGGFHPVLARPGHSGRHIVRYFLLPTPEHRLVPNPSSKMPA
jgi:alpha-glucoside transport system substrate-binding protein